MPAKHTTSAPPKPNHRATTALRADALLATAAKPTQLRTQLESASSAPPTRAQRLIHWLNRAFTPSNPYFDKLVKDPAAAFAYAIRSGHVVLQSFDGYNDLTGKTVLDFGCGTGGKTVHYATRGPRHTIGVDFEPDTTRASQYARDHNLSVEFHHLLADDRIPLPNNSIDVTISSSVLEHIVDPAHAFAELRRVLRPGGLMLNRWHPYRSRHGAHLGGALGIPCAHHIFRTADLVQAYRRELLSRYGQVPPVLRRLRPDSTSLDDLVFHLNRWTVTRMTRAAQSAGFRLLAHRYYRGRRPVRFPLSLPPSWVDYVIDYDVHVCQSTKIAG